MKLDDKISTIPYVGSKYEILFNSLEVFTIRDLLRYYPFRYEDSSKIVSFEDLNREEKKTVIGELLSIKNIRTRKRRVTLQKGLIESSDGEQLEITWFNQPYLKDSLRVGSKYLVFGKLNPKSLKPELTSPEIELLSDDTKNIGRISPVYSLTAGLKTKWLRARIKWIVDKIDYIVDFEDNLSPNIKNEFSLFELKEALRAIHFPKNQEDLDQARERIGFDELLEIQIKIEKNRIEREKLNSTPINFNKEIINSTKQNLKFELTKDQNSSLEEILEEITKDKPMDMLLQGDVGTGKTIVAVLSALAASSAGYRTIYLAPTTILSEQIYNEFVSILGKERVYLSNSQNKLTEEVEDNAIIIGTHAVLHLPEVYFENLNFLIIDEEHRFGVGQREHLLKFEEKFRPHKLSMTATPIPRSLAMSIWGDTKITYIKSKPKQRKEKQTLYVPNNKKKDSYGWIKEQMKEHDSQLFWVCPLINESEVLNAKSTEEIYKEVKENFKEYKVELVHGKTKNKEEKIEEFKDKKFDILVTTPIIEVGIDIPNANLIVIESSERFGLAQLHQLRGRVGRGDKQGTCILFTTDSDLTDDQKSRIKYFVSEPDGLKLAEFDLRRRGPGEVYGSKQSGIPDLKIADIFDEELLKKVKKAVRMIDIT